MKIAIHPPSYPFIHQAGYNPQSKSGTEYIYLVLLLTAALGIERYCAVDDYCTPEIKDGSCCFAKKSIAIHNYPICQYAVHLVFYFAAQADKSFGLVLSCSRPGAWHRSPAKSLQVSIRANYFTFCFSITHSFHHHQLFIYPLVVACNGALINPICNFW